MKKWLSSLLRWGLRGKQRLASLLARRRLGLWRLPLHLEALEQRLVPALVTWNGQGDHTSWNDPHNWSGGALPGPADDVVINPTPAGTVEFTQGAMTVNTLRDNG